MVRRILLTLAPIGLIAAMPAQAQIFWQPPDLSGAPMTASEDGFGVPLPGATQAEKDAGLLWSLRSGLNVAALQCGFDRTLRTESTYNALINDHKAELAAAFAKLDAYFKRTGAGQKALDSYGGKVYSGFSAVQGQLTFCTAGSIVGRKALLAKPGTLINVARENLRMLYVGVKGGVGEQFYRRPWLSSKPASPIWDDRCWKGGSYDMSCGSQ